MQEKKSTDERPLDGLRTTPEARVLCPTQLMFLQAMVLEESPESASHVLSNNATDWCWFLMDQRLEFVILSVHYPSLAFVQ